MRRLVGIAIRALCTVGLATATLPLAALPAQAESIGADNSFTVDNITYTVTAGYNVAVSGVADPSALTSVLTLPSTVKYGDATHSVSEYKLVGVYSAAFRNCTKLVDLRVPDIGDGRIYATAFDGCTNLKTIHLMGGAVFTRNIGTEATDFGGVDNLSIVVHGEVFDFSTGGSISQSSVNFPSNTTIYYAADFCQESTTTTAYVAGVGRVGGEATTITTPSMLSNPESVPVYCDAAEESDSLCPVKQVPALENSGSSWVVNTLYEQESQRQLAPDEAIAQPVKVTEAASNDLSGAALTVEPMYFDGTDQHPQTTLVSASGQVLTDGVDYTVEDISDNPEVKLLDSWTRMRFGTYSIHTIKATGIGSYTGSCTGEMTMYNPYAMWYRGAAADRYASANNIASRGSAIATQAATDRTKENIAYNNGYTAVTRHRGAEAPYSIYNSARVVINPDDYASCLVSASLAGLFGVNVVSVPKDLDAEGLSADAKVQLSAARNGLALVLGSESSISKETKDAISERMDKGATRVAGSATDAASTAVEAYNFIRKLEAGEYSLSLPSSYVTYGTTAVIVPEGETSVAYSAAAWAYGNFAPIFFCGADGSLSEDTVKALKGTNPSTGKAFFENVVVAGGTEAVRSNIAASVPALDVCLWASEADECATSAAWNNANVAAGTAQYSAVSLACPGADWGCLAAAACDAGSQKGILLIADFTNDPQGSFETMAPFLYRISYGVVAAGYDDFSQKTYEELVRNWDWGIDNSINNLRFGSVTVNGSYSYDGNAVTPSITVTDRNGKTLTEGEDYKVSYISNAANKGITAQEVVDPGTYTVTVTGTYYSVSGGFSGDDTEYNTYWYSRSAAFEITGELPDQEPVAQPPAKAQIKKVKAGKRFVKATWAKVYKATKYQLQYRIMGSSSWKSAKASAKATSLKVKGLFVNRRYEVRLRAGNAAGWGAWSATKLSAKVK